MDSVIRSNIEPGASQHIEMVQVPVSEDGNLKSRKFIITMTLVIISSIFTGIGLMSIDMWMYFNGALTASYIGANLYQKKTL